MVQHWGAGSFAYLDPEIRKLAETTGAGLLLTEFATIRTPIDHFPRFEGPDRAEVLFTVVRRLADESGHPELADAPILFWGHSAAGNFGPAFATLYPQRTIAFVLYQSAAVGVFRTDADVRALNRIPLLVFSDSSPPSFPSAESLWRRGRGAGGPWTLAAQPDAPHGSGEYRKKANDLLIPWMTAVIRRRLPADGGDLRIVTDESVWLGDLKTGEVIPAAAFSGPKAERNWLPDESTARGWQVVHRAPK